MTDKEFTQIVSKNLRRIAYEKGKSQKEIAKALNVGQSTVACWFNGIRTPRMDKIDALCDYLGCERDDVTLEYDPTRRRAYYLDKDTAKKAQALYENSYLRMLFDAADGSKPEDLQMAADLLKRLKGTNPDA